MANNIQFNGQQIKTNQYTPRHVVNFIPSVYNTDAMRNFTQATWDHWFQPGKLIDLNGYIGDRPMYFKDNDVYIREDDSARKFYQLTPSMVSATKSNTDYNAILSYDDYITYLNGNGANTLNHNTLFGDTFLSWCPPVDLDKLINFTNYVWIKNGPPTVEVIGPKITYTVKDTSQIGYATPADSDGKPLPIVTPDDPANDIPKIAVYVSEKNDGSDYKTYLYEYQYTLDRVNGTITFLLGSVPYDGSRIRIDLPEYSISDPNRFVEWITGPLDPSLPATYPPSGVGLNIDGTAKPPLQIYQTPRNSDGSVKPIRTQNEIDGKNNTYAVVVRVDGVDWAQNTDYSVDAKNSLINFDKSRKPSYDSIVDIYLNTDIQKDCLGQAHYSFANFTATSGIRAMFINDWNTKPDIPVKSSYNNVTYIMEGIGDSILIINDDNPIIYVSDPTDSSFKTQHADLWFGQGAPNDQGYQYTTRGVQKYTFKNGDKIVLMNDVDQVSFGPNSTWLVSGVGDTVGGINLRQISYFNPRPSDNPEYHVIQRGSIDNNPWSVRNRWFHKDLINSKTITSTYIVASRPILEYNKNIQLYNYGAIRRLYVDLVCEEYPNLVTKIYGKTGDEAGQSIIIDGTKVDINNVTNITNNRMRILFKSKNPENPYLNNMVYLISTRYSDGSTVDIENIDWNKPRIMIISIESDGVNPDGKPYYQEILGVAGGNKWKNSEVYYDGTSWIRAQEHPDADIAPLFQLYDWRGNKLQDSSVYPVSNFAGNQLFGYSLADTNPIDSVLNLRVSHDNNGQILFENYISTKTYTYQTGSKQLDIIGYYFYFIYTDQRGQTGIYSNSWYKSSAYLKQFLIQQLQMEKNQKLVIMNVTPDDSSIDNLVVTKNYSQLTLNIDYFVNGNKLLIPDAQMNDIVTLKIYSSDDTAISESTLYYEIPKNLSANPIWDEPSICSIGQLYYHLTEIMTGNKQFQGQLYRSNNWRDIKTEKWHGTEIIQSFSPLLKPMLFASVDHLDLVKSIEFAAKEYMKIRNNLLQKLFDMYNTNSMHNNEDPEAWLKVALAAINMSKTNAFPFWLSAMAVENNKPTWIPGTPSFFGIMPLVDPVYFDDTTTKTPTTYLRCHDGSLISTYGDIRDDVLYALEQKIYNSANDVFKTSDLGIMPVTDIVSGRFRNSEYNWRDFQNIVGQYFKRWCIENKLDYTANTTFDPNNKWTWNWGSLYDSAGNQLPGYWRQIYRYYYDTDCPHTNPWEMLGFSIKPTWWEDRYGPAPWTSANRLLWNDVATGFIYDGERKGYDQRYARPDIWNYIPVSLSGVLLDPYAIGIAQSLPSMVQASSGWNIGDGSPIETAWIRSSHYRYAVAIALYLMKPAKFVERCWEPDKIIIINAGTTQEQFIRSDTGTRVYKDLYVHGEKNQSGTLVKALGVQQWISDYVVNLGKNITENFGDLLRNLNSQLTYRVSGFTNKKTLLITSEIFDALHDGDFTVDMYRTPPIKMDFYGGIIIEWNGNGYIINGYDTINPYFTVHLPIKESRYQLISAGGISTEINAWMPNTYYSLNVIVKYNRSYYSCIKSHTSAKTFETVYWQQISKPQSASSTEIFVYEDYDTSQDITIPYGSYFRTPQEIADIMFGWQKYLESKGWIFSDPDSMLSETPTVFADSVIEFLKWNQIDWKPGNFIALSPASKYISYATDMGEILNLDYAVHGSYSIVDRSGSPINLRDLRITRDEGKIIIRPNTQVGIFAVRLRVVTIEHIFVFKNRTIFDDIVYDPLYNVKQTRLKLQGQKSSNWKGRINAPGFVISNDVLIPNFDTAAEDFRTVFNVEGCSNPIWNQYARHNLGFTEAGYFFNFGMSTTSQFDFYRGMLSHKGTPAVFNRLIRNTNVNVNSNLEFLDEWAILTGSFGEDWKTSNLIFNLTKQDLMMVPQVVSFDTKVWDENVDGYPNTSTKTILTQISGTDLYLKNNTAYQLFVIDGVMNVSIDAIEIQVSTPFAGVIDDSGAFLPYLNVGTDVSNNDLVSDFLLNAKTIVDTKFQSKIYDTGTTINAYFSNPGNIPTDSDTPPSVSITIKWSYTTTYWSRFIPSTINYISLYDIISKNQGTFLYEHPKWNQRPLNTAISFETTNKYKMNKHDTLSAGYVNMNDIKWFAPKWFDFVNIYSDARTESPPKIIEKQIPINATTVNDSQDWQIVPTLSSGLYRITKIVVNVKQGWRPESTPKLVLYSKKYDTDPNGEEIDIATIVGSHNGDPLTIANNYISHPYVFVPQEPNLDTSIRLKFSQKKILGLRGQMTVLVVVERVNSQIIPNDMVWCYNTGGTNVDWQVYKLYDTGLNASIIYNSGNDQQGALLSIDVDAVKPPIPVVAASDNPQQGYIQSVFNNLNTNSLIVIDGLALDNSSNFNDIFNPVFESQYITYIDYGTIYDSNVIPIYGETGFYIKDIEINLLTPYDGTAALTISAISDTLVYPVAEEPIFSRIALARPLFTDTANIYIDVYDPSLTIAEYEPGKTRQSGVIYDDTLKIRIIRDGNIFLSPTTITVYDQGMGYQTTPSVIIDTGRQTPLLATNGGTSAILQVRAIAGQQHQPGVNDSLIGPITDIEVVNGGSAYTYAKINILGRGNGATTHNTVIIGGVIQPWNINNSMATQGSGYGWDTEIVVTTYGGPVMTAAASIVGQVKRILVTSGGTGFVTKPTIIFVGGGGYGAKALPLLRNGVIVKVFVDPNDPDWKNGVYGTLGDPLGEMAGMNPSMVSMGKNYSATPQILITTNTGSASNVILTAVLDYIVPNVTITNSATTGYFDPNAMSVAVDTPTAEWSSSNPSLYTAKAKLNFNHQATDLKPYLPKTNVHWQITRSDGARAWSNQPFTTNKNGLTGGTSWKHVSTNIHFYQALELNLPNTGYWYDEVTLDLNEVRANLYTQNSSGQWIFTPDSNPLSIESAESWTFEIVQMTPWSQNVSINYYDTPIGIQSAGTPLVLRNTSCTITVLNTITDNPTSRDFFLQYPTTTSKVIKGDVVHGVTQNLYTSKYSDNGAVRITLSAADSTKGSVSIIVNYGYKSSFELYNVQGSSTILNAAIPRSPGNPDGTGTVDLAAYNAELNSAQSISFNQTSVPYQTTNIINGGDIFVWVPCRFDDWNHAMALSSMPPKGYWDTTDIIYLDNGRTAYEIMIGEQPIWKIFECVNIPVSFVKIKSFWGSYNDDEVNNPDNIPEYDELDPDYMKMRTGTPSTPLPSTPGTPGTAPAPTTSPGPTPTPTPTPVPYIAPEFDIKLTGLDTSSTTYVIFHTDGTYPKIDTNNWLNGVTNDRIVPNTLYSLTFNSITAKWELKYPNSNTRLYIRDIDIQHQLYVKWYQKVQEEQKVNSALIKSSWISNNTGQVQKIIEQYDPVKNVIPGVIERELYYKSDSDPAFYNQGSLGATNSNPWGSNQVGRLWWDLSNLVYIDYEQSDLLYRAKYWGKLAPRVFIKIYEWIESPVIPSAYYALTISNTDYTGYPKYPLNEGYVQSTKWNDLAQIFETKYYFWVEYKTTPSQLSERKMTCYQVALLLQDPTKNDLTWFSAVSKNAVAFSNINQYISDFGSSICVNTKSVDSYYDSKHNQWKLLKKGDNDTNIDQNLWQKMTDSLIGWDSNVDTINATSLGCSLTFLDWSGYKNKYIELYINNVLEISDYQIKSSNYLTEICNILNQKDQYFATKEENTLYISVSEDIRSYAKGWKVQVKMYDSIGVLSYATIPDAQWIDDMPIYIVEADTVLRNKTFISWMSVTNSDNLMHDGLINVNDVWFSYEYSTVYSDLSYAFVPAPTGYGQVSQNNGIVTITTTYGELNVNVSEVTKTIHSVSLSPNEYIYTINATIVNSLSSIPNNDLFQILMSDDTTRTIAVKFPAQQQTTYDIITGFIAFQPRVHRLYNVVSTHNTEVTVGSSIVQTYKKSNPRVVPDSDLPENEKYGNLFNPRQSWFKVNYDSNGVAVPIKDSRKDFVESFNMVAFNTDIPLTMERLEWSDIFTNGSSDNIDPEPSITQYSYKSVDMFDRNSYVSSLMRGQRILVQGVTETNNFWTLWEYDPNHYLSDEWGFWLVKAQKWRLQEGEFWNFVDWYAQGYSATDYPMYSYATLNDMNVVLMTNPSQFGQNIIQVDDSGDGKWIWYILGSDGLKIVGKEKGTIQLSSLFYGTSRMVYGVNDYNLGNIPFRDGSHELQYIMNQIYTMLLKNKERNQIFFDMAISSMKLNYNTDWIFKSSFIYVGGSAASLMQSPITAKNIYDDLIAYIDAVKPYHVKIRDHTFRITSPIDAGIFHVADFDNPVYFDSAIKGYRNLDVSNIYDLDVFRTTYPWQDWFNNYQKSGNDPSLWNGIEINPNAGYENYNPIRKINTKLKFNRISPYAINGWDSSGIGWDAPIVTWTSDGKATDFRDLDARLRLPYNDGSPTRTIDPRLENNKYHSYRWIGNCDTCPDCKCKQYDSSVPINDTISGSPFYQMNITNRCIDKQQVKYGKCCQEIIETVPDGNGNEIPNTQILHLTPDWDNIKKDFTNIPNPFKPGNRFKDTVVLSFVDRNALTILQKQPDGSSDCYVVSGTIVAVTQPTLTYWIWEPINATNKCNGNWVQFESTKWDNLSQGGMADDIQEYYIGTLGLPNKDTPDLIDGAVFQKTTIDGGALELTEIEDLKKVLAVKNKKMKNLIQRILNEVMVTDSNGNPVPIKETQIPTWAYEPNNSNVLAKLYRIFELEINTLQNEVDQYNYDFPWQYFNSATDDTDDIIQLLTERKQSTMEQLNYDLSYNPSDPIATRQQIDQLQDVIEAIRVRGWWDTTTIAQQSLYTTSTAPNPITYPAGYIPNSSWPSGTPQDLAYGKYGYQGIRRILINLRLVKPNRNGWVDLYNSILTELQTAEKNLANIYRPWDSLVILKRLNQLNSELSFEQDLLSLLNSYANTSMNAEQQQILAEQTTLCNNNISRLSNEINWLSPRVFSPISLDNSSYNIDGDSFIQPEYGTRPQENVTILSRSPFNITIWMAPDTRPLILGNLSNVQLVVRSKPIFDTYDAFRNPSDNISGDVNNDGVIGNGESFEIDFKLTNETFSDALNVSLHDPRLIIVSGSNTVDDYGSCYGFLYPWPSISPSVNNIIIMGTIYSNTSVVTTYAQDLCVDIPANASSGDSFKIQVIVTSDGVDKSLEFGPFIIGSITNGQIYDAAPISDLSTLPVVTPLYPRKSETDPSIIPAILPLGKQNGSIKAYRLSKDGNEFWNQSRFVNTNVILDEVILQPGFGQNTIQVRWNGSGSPREDALHNPDFPDPRFIENVKTNNVMYANTLNDGSDIAWVLDASFTISLAFNAFNKIISNKTIFELNEPVIVYDPYDTSTEKRWLRGSIKEMHQGDSTTLPYIVIYATDIKGSGTTKYAVIENEKMFKTPGAVWINNEKITYWTRTQWQSDGTCTLGSDDLPIQRGVDNTASGIVERHISKKYVSDGRTKKYPVPSIDDYTLNNINDYIYYGYDLDIAQRIRVIIHQYGKATDPSYMKYKWIGSYTLSSSDYTIVNDNGQYSVVLNNTVSKANYNDSKTLAPNIQIDIALITPNDSLLYNTYDMNYIFIGKKDGGYGTVTDKGNGLISIEGKYGVMTANISSNVMNERTAKRLLPDHYLYDFKTTPVDQGGGNIVDVPVVNTYTPMPTSEPFAYKMDDGTIKIVTVKFPPKANTYPTLKGYIRPSNYFYASHIPIDVYGNPTPIYDCSMMHTVPTNKLLDSRRPPWSRVYKTNVDVIAQSSEPTRVEVGNMWYDILNRSVKVAISVDSNNVVTWYEYDETISDIKQLVAVGNGAPTSSLPAFKNGPRKDEYYEDSSSTTVYQFDGTNWNIFMVIGSDAPSSSTPASPNTGEYYFDSTAKITYLYDGTTWNALDTNLKLIYEPTKSKLLLTGGHETVRDFNDREEEWKQFVKNWT